MSDRMVAVWVVDAGIPGLHVPERGKSELHRAVCRITSGRVSSSSLYGKCHREYTALGRVSERRELARSSRTRGQSRCKPCGALELKPTVRVKRCGKSAPLAQ